MDDINQLVGDVAAALRRNNLLLVTAESCTGGMIAEYLTRTPGSSEWFEGAFVTYRLSAKERMIGVRPSTLDTFGAVSEPTVREMAEGALRASDAQVSVAVTGVAGPDGGDLLAPVGTVWFGWGLKRPDPQCVQTARYDIDGNRDSVRRQAVRIALEGLRQLLGDGP
ncbi:MAG: CinA family protein [Pseudomonadales bacterium]